MAHHEAMSASPEPLRRVSARPSSPAYRLQPGRCVVVTPPEAPQLIGRARLRLQPVAPTAVGTSLRLRFRRGSIRAHAASALLEGWRWAGEAAAATSAVPASAAPDAPGAPCRRGTVTVHLLRATRAGVCSREEAAQWRAWAAAQRAAGAVLLLVVQDPPERGWCGRRPTGPLTRTLTARRGSSGAPWRCACDPSTRASPAPSPSGSGVSPSRARRCSRCRGLVIPAAAPRSGGPGPPFPP